MGYSLGMNAIARAEIHRVRSMPGQQEMERALRRRDESYDGVFYLGVKTTGVFCRPSCPARKPLARNIEYFAAARDALFAGYRACKRCHPLEANGRPPGWVRRLLAAVEPAGGPHGRTVSAALGPGAARLTDSDLRGMGIGPARARRYFLRHYGMTFQAFQRARRMGMALTQIREGRDVTDVALGHGYESLSGFRDAFARKFGKPPGKARSEQCILTELVQSPVGPLLLGATDEGFCLLEFCDRRALEKQIEVARRRLGCAVAPGTHRYLAAMRGQLAEYFAGRRRTFDVPLVYPGTEFQQRVWKALLRIPYGRTWSYERLAEEVGHPGAQRAVGTANGANRIAIVIPCHRVVNKNGKLGGYGGGLWRKQMLLDLERGQRTI